MPPVTASATRWAGAAVAAWLAWPAPAWAQPAADPLPAVALPPANVLQRIAGADHFFAGSEDRIAAAAATFTGAESIH